MVDDFKNIKDSIFRSVISTLNSVSETDSNKKTSESNGAKMDPSSAKELLSMAANWAGKGKDEIVQILCREVGLAVAAMIKEPLTQVLENRKLQISLELVPKDELDKEKKAAKPKTKKAASPSNSKKTKK